MPRSQVKPYRGIDVNRPEINVYEMQELSEWSSNVQIHLVKPIYRNITFAFRERAGS